MLEVVVCSGCGEESPQVARAVDDIDREVCPCGYSYIVLSVAAYEPVYSQSKRLLREEGPRAKAPAVR